MYNPEEKASSGSNTDNGFCALVLVTLSTEAYRNPESIANVLAKHRVVESVDIVAGDWELILKIRTKDQDEFYDFLKKVICKESGIVKANSIITLRRVKPVCAHETLDSSKNKTS
jgi:DNA-binding Lrp family transcriptional regulator